MDYYDGNSVTGLWNLAQRDLMAPAETLYAAQQGKRLGT